MSDPRKKYNSDAERQTARRIRFYAQGLNSQGKPYGRHPNFVGQNESPSIQRQQQLARRSRKLKLNRDRYHRQAKLNRAQGLRVDGQPFRRHIRFHAWKNFRATVPAAPSMDWDRVERV